MGRKPKPKTTLDEFTNWWLNKYHNTSLDELLKTQTDLMYTLAWYKKYPVTPEQHDEWYDWAIATVCKEYRMSAKMAKRQFVFAYLNCAPCVKDIE